MYSKARRSADVLVAAAVVLVALAPASGVASIEAAELSGTVTDATGLALTGVVVEARPAGAVAPVQTALTDRTGMFTLSALDPSSLLRGNGTAGGPTANEETRVGARGTCRDHAINGPRSWTTQSRGTPAIDAQRLNWLRRRRAIRSGGGAHPLAATRRLLRSVMVGA